jgi:hypothetical protein
MSDKISDDNRELLRVVLVHHMSGVADHDALMLGNSAIALLLVRAAHLTALLTIDQKHWASNPPQEFESLGCIERLRRRSPVERIELPDPLAPIVLFHCGARDLQSPVFAQTRVRLAQLAGARREARVLAKMPATALVQLGNPFLHFQGSIGKSHADRSDSFNQHQLFYALGKCTGIEK